MGIAVLIGLASYAIGSIPFGYVIAKTRYRIDIREHGSKNTGATNVWRTLGKGPGLTTLALDTAKGFAPVFVTSRLFPGQEFLALLAGISSIIGHNWSVFLRGKGGKGVATSGGVFLALIPKPMGVSVLIFLAFFLSTRYVSVGSMAAAAALSAMTFVFPTSNFFRSVVLLAAGLILIRHVPNVKRLIAGQEPKVDFGFWKKDRRLDSDQ